MLQLLLIFSILLLNTCDLFLIFCLFELMSFICIIFLVPLNQSIFIIESAIKYLIFNAVASAILAFGLFLVYFSACTLFLYDLQLLTLSAHFAGEFAQLEYYYFILVMGFVCILLGLFCKLAAFPLHWWAPDVYEGSSLYAFGLLSFFFKCIYFFILVKVHYLLVLPLHSHFLVFSYLYQGVGLASVIIGIFGAFANFEIKRFFAFSSMVSLGFVFIAFSSLTVLGLCIGFYLFFTYYFGFLLVLHVLFLSNQTVVNGGPYGFVRYLMDLRGIAGYSMFYASILTLAFLSLAGIPPLLGFFGKLYFFAFLVKINYFFFLIFCVGSSVLSAFYYFRILKMMWFEEPSFFNMLFLIPSRGYSFNEFNFLILENFYFGGPYSLIMHFYSLRFFFDRVYLGLFVFFFILIGLCYPVVLFKGCSEVVLSSLSLGGYYLFFEIFIV